MGYWLQQTLNGLLLASFYVPLAVAFALIQGVTRRVFLSFGDMAMFASFAAIYACFASLVRGEGEALAATIALGVAIACAAALGAVIARMVMIPALKGTAQSFMIASIGLSIMLQETMRIQSGSRDVWVPPLFAGDALWEWPGAFNARLGFIQGAGMLVALAAILFVAAVMRRSGAGRQWRAYSQSAELASLCGLDGRRIVVMTFAAASGLAAVSGWLSAVSYGGTNFTIGLMMGFKAMFAAVIGGFGSVQGAIIGGLSLAALEVLWTANFSTLYRDAFVFAIIVAALALRPEGLAGVARKRESEAP